ncbi:MAG: diacylglycerol kinase family lipid kinase [Clostridia bacterium]|nr:diacylglycerol kinase family lipid kinase [Clostridia bacterium]
MHHIIANPHAGTRKILKIVNRLEQIFENAGFEYDVHYTTRVKDAEDTTREMYMHGERDFIVVGGDGTLHEVLNGLVDPTQCRLGLIPAGTGNDFAATVQIPEDVEKAAEIVLRGEVKETDYLTVGGVRCMNVAGMGIDVDVLERCRRGKTRGKIKYLMSLVQSLFTFKGYSITIEKDGVTEDRSGLIAAVCNGRQFGSGIKVCPVADPADGKINLITADYLGSVFKIVHAFTYLMRGKVLEYPAARHCLCERVRIYSDVPRTLQLDGELYEGLEFDAKIERGLKMYR